MLIHKSELYCPQQILCASVLKNVAKMWKFFQQQKSVFVKIKHISRWPVILSSSRMWGPNIIQKPKTNSQINKLITIFIQFLLTRVKFSPQKCVLHKLNLPGLESAQDHSTAGVQIKDNLLRDEGDGGRRGQVRTCPSRKCSYTWTCCSHSQLSEQK